MVRSGGMVRQKIPMSTKLLVGIIIAIVIDVIVLLSVLCVLINS